MPKRLQTSISRLSILFLASILIPGLILSWLGLRTISFQGELTEKRVQEALSALCDSLAGQFDRQLISGIERFFAVVDRGEPIHRLYWSASGTTESAGAISLPGSSARLPGRTGAEPAIPGFAGAFSISSSGQLLFPRAHDQSRTVATKTIPKARAKAQRHEFAGRLAEAASGYRQALQTARGAAEQAAAQNGLARVLVKQADLKRAVQEYQRLALQFGAIADETGVPYADYALHQLARITRIGEEPAARAAATAILGQICAGKLPLSSQFSMIRHELLEAFPAAAAGQDLADDQLFAYLVRAAALNEFILRHRQQLADYAAGKRESVVPLRGYDVLTAGAVHQRTGSDPSAASEVIPQPGRDLSPTDEAIPPPGDAPHTPDAALAPCLLIIRPGSDPQPGLVLEITALRLELLSRPIPAAAPHPVTLEIVNRQEIPEGSKWWRQVRELSLYAPDWRVVAAADPRQILQEIRTRRLIYSLSLAFLILGMALGVIMVFRDMARERRLARLRSEFVSSVTHELKTPLTAIRMYAETLRLGRIRSPRDRNDYLKVIVNESERLTRLINTVLDFSQIERGRKEYSPRLIDLSQTAADALETLKFTLSEGGFSVVKEIESGIQLQADPDAMEQALLNLLSNAIKYSGTRREITLRLHRDGSTAVLEVEDQGIGIPEDELENIFTPYYRVGSGAGSGRGGAGLGLAVVHHIVTAHNGRISASSRPGKGSTFTITLPLEDVSHGG